VELKLAYRKIGPYFCVLPSGSGPWSIDIGGPTSKNALVKEAQLVVGYGYADILICGPVHMNIILSSKQITYQLCI